jgi:hypothetical protein
MTRPCELKLILVSGGWSSGTTAVAGVLANVGLTGFGPYYITNDERTPNSFEFVPFRELVQSFASEPKVKVTEKSTQRINHEISLFRERVLNQEFGPFDPLSSPPFFLKYPLSALLISELKAHFDIRLIVVTRPLRAIEETRLRRGWPSYLGAKGAGVIYSHLFDAILEYGLPAHFVHYPHLLRDPEPFIRSIIDFCGYAPGEARLHDAVRFITGSTSAKVSSKP